jgi:hypothetical protein
MLNSTRSLVGTLISSTAHLSGLRVEAWDAQGNCPDLIDVALTDARGHFTMQLEADYISELLPQRQPAISFRIFDNGKLIPQTQPVIWQVTQQSTQLTIPIGAAASVAAVAAVTPAPSVVRGHISNGDGSAASNRMVRAFDRNIASSGFNDVQLGQTSTAADGQYEIHYFMPTGGKLKPDLIVRVDALAAVTTPLAPKAIGTVAAPGIGLTPVRPPVATTGTGVTSPASGITGAPATVTPAAARAAESPLAAKAPTIAMVDLSLDNVAAALLSEHRTLLAPVSNVVSGVKLQLPDLAGDQLDYVASVTGLQPERLQTMVQAAQLSRDAGGAVDAEIFYGLLRTGHEGDLSALATVPVDVQRARLEVAIDQNFISATYEPQIDNIVTALQSIVVSRAMPTNSGSIVSAALSNSIAGTDVQTSFVSRWVGRTGSAQQFWNDLRADTTLGAHADDLETTLRLDMLFDGFQPALADLRAQRQSNGIRSLRDLARWQDTDWQSFLARVGTPAYVTGDTAADKATNYIRTLAPKARAAFPTEYLRGRASITPPPLETKFLPTLAAANPTLDLTRPLPETPNWDTISVADQPAARAEWSAFQREARTFSHTPARMLLGGVVTANGANSIRAAANAFLTRSTVDLEQTTVDQYLAANPKALDDIEATDRPTVVSYLKSVQRVLRIVAKPEAVETLLGDGLNSALRIARLSRAEFVDRYANLLGGEATAQTAYSTAFRTAAMAQLALTTTAQSMADVSPWAIRGGSTSKFTIPDYGSVLNLLKTTAGAANDAATWPHLFQGEAWCDCEECQSIYGPAAYFVDLLHMLDPDGSDPAPVDHLFDRRPDLPNLLLTCDNTNTPLPYIDLVNEILELHIAQNHGYTIPGTNPPILYATSTSFDNTGIPADELRAAPQNLIDQVYDEALATSVYPFTLPFQRSLAVMRAYLDQLGTTYYDLLAAFGPGDGNAGLNAAERLAAETLGLTTRQFKLIAGLPVPPDQPITLAGCYGYGANDSHWQGTLSVVSELLLRTGITYDDLYALIGDQSQAGTYFLNRTGAVTLDPPEQGEIDGTNIHVAPDTYERLHRFIRLWRATAWSIADVDRVLFAVGAQSDHTVALDRDALCRFALVKQVVDKLAQPLAAALTLWSDLDTWGTDSLYLALFQNRSVTRLDDATLFALAGDPAKKPASGAGELANANQPMSDHVATILAALRISAADLEVIWDHALGAGAFGSVSSRDDTKLNLHNLTVVYRYTVLARGLGLRIADLVELLELTGDNPFAPNDPAPTLAFIARAAMIQNSGCSIPTLSYVYRCYSAPGQGPAPADSMVLDALAKIWAALRQVHQDTAVTDDPDGTLLSSRLALIQPPEIVQSILEALDPSKGRLRPREDRP